MVDTPALLKLKQYDRKVLRRSNSTLMPNPDREDISHPRVNEQRRDQAFSTTYRPQSRLSAKNGSARGRWYNGKGTTEPVISKAVGRTRTDAARATAQDEYRYASATDSPGKGTTTGSLFPLRLARTKCDPYHANDPLQRRRRQYIPRLTLHRAHRLALTTSLHHPTVQHRPLPAVIRAGSRPPSPSSRTSPHAHMTQMPHHPTSPLLDPSSRQPRTYQTPPQETQHLHTTENQIRCRARTGHNSDSKRHGLRSLTYGTLQCNPVVQARAPGSAPSSTNGRTEASARSCYSTDEDALL